MKLRRLICVIAFGVICSSFCLACASPSSERAEGKIVFVKWESAHGVSNLYMMNADGTGLTQLTSGDNEDYGPVWSPDGTKIAYVSDQDGNREIYVIKPDGTDQIRLTFSDEDQIVRGLSEGSAPAWSPDGNWIAFYSTRDGNAEIYVMRADGSEQTRLTYNSAIDMSPHWSPDGKQIGFISTRDYPGRVMYPNLQPYVMNSDGTDQASPFEFEAYSGSPNWSPTGNLLLLGEPTVGVPANVFSRVVVFDLTTGDARLLTAKYAEQLGKHSEDLPEWSPDGKWVVFSMERQICIIRVTGEELTCLTEGTDPDWGP